MVEPAPSIEPERERDLGSVPHLVQLLTTEHWSLLTARSLAYNEAFTRASMFLTFVSMSFVGLALLAQATGFSSDFLLITAVVLCFDLVIALVYVRPGRGGKPRGHARDAGHEPDPGCVRAHRPGDRSVPRHRHHRRLSGRHEVLPDHGREPVDSRGRRLRPIDLARARRPRHGDARRTPRRSDRRRSRRRHVSRGRRRRDHRARGPRPPRRAGYSAAMRAAANLDVRFPTPPEDKPA